MYFSRKVFGVTFLIQPIDWCDTARTALLKEQNGGIKLLQTVSIC